MSPSSSPAAFQLTSPPVSLKLLTPRTSASSSPLSKKRYYKTLSRTQVSYNLVYPVSRSVSSKSQPCILPSDPTDPIDPLSQLTSSSSVYSIIGQRLHRIIAIEHTIQALLSHTALPSRLTLHATPHPHYLTALLCDLHQRYPFALLIQGRRTLPPTLHSDRPRCLSSASQRISVAALPVPSFGRH
jgi:hypothetical protein